MKDYFSDREYACRCGKCGLGREHMSGDFKHRLNHIRYHLGEPMRMTSAVRCHEHSLKVSTALFSPHEYRGKPVAAADFLMLSHTVYELVRLAQSHNMSIGFKPWGPGLYMVHLDEAHTNPTFFGYL